MFDWTILQLYSYLWNRIWNFTPVVLSWNFQLFLHSCNCCETKLTHRSLALLVAVLSRTEQNTLSQHFMAWKTSIEKKWKKCYINLGPHYFISSPCLSSWAYSSDSELSQLLSFILMCKSNSFTQNSVFPWSTSTEFSAEVSRNAILKHRKLSSSWYLKGDTEDWANLKI